MTARKTVLIVTSSYAPAMIADMQRARLLAWELPAFGWNVEVLAPDSSYQFANCLDSDSDEFFCPHTPVHFTRPYKEVLPSIFRSSSIGWKALIPLNSVGSDLLKQGRIDLVYLSTTQFNLFLLGRLWHNRYKIPYVLDIHDPIFRESRGYGGGTADGLKRTVNQWLHKKIEAITVPSACALMSVSAKYTEVLQSRYSTDQLKWMRPLGHATIPFAASERDFAQAAVRMTIAKRADGDLRRVIYVGAGGVVMARAFRTFCLALRGVIERRRELVGQIRFELYGTIFSWQVGEKKDLSDIAAECGVADMVVEDPRRVSYRRSLELLLGAQGAMVLGVDDEGYMPSKLYNYALSDKPLLGVMRSPSSGHDAFSRILGLGHLVSFGDHLNSGDTASGVVERFVDEVISGKNFSRKEMIANHLASEMARQHAEIFDSCIAQTPREQTAGVA